MLVEIRLNNFRNFHGFKSTKLELKRITALTGSNNAGKSTIIKALLLLRQSIQAPKSPKHFDQVGRMNFVGAFADLGDFETLVNENDLSKKIHLGVTIQNDFPRNLFEPHLELFDADLATTLDQADQKGASVPLNVHMDYYFASIASLRKKSSSYKLKKLGIGPGDRRGGILIKAKQRISLGQKELISWETTFKDPISPDIAYEFAVNNRFANIFDIHPDKAEPLELRDNQIVFDVFLSGLSPQALLGVEPKRSGSKLKSGPRFMFRPLPKVLFEATLSISTALNSLEYLGPLRSEGERYYTLKESHAGSYDTVGKFLPYALRDRLEEKIAYCAPAGTKEVRARLRTALNSWLYYLKTGKPPKSNLRQEFRSLFHKHFFGEIKLRGSAQRKYSLADSGFGFSQVLPVLVRGLLTQQGGIFIVEQPELHLNPALQVRLADFFQALAISGRTVLVETHSEHLVNALRVLVAEDLSNTLQDKISTTFITTDRGRPQVMDLGVQSDGSLKNWPREFFGEATRLSSRLLRAQAAQAKRSKS